MGVTFRRLLSRFDRERIVFRLTRSYRKIEQLEKQECKKYFTLEEQKIFQTEINLVFKDSIQEIRTLCPALTDEDLLLCYLAAEHNLPNAIICYCLGTGNSFPIKQRKYRINLKMTESQCKTLFALIFRKCPIKDIL